MFHHVSYSLSFPSFLSLFPSSLSLSFSSGDSFLKYLVTGEFPPLVEGVTLVYRKNDGEPDNDDELKNGANRRNAKTKKAWATKKV